MSLAIAMPAVVIATVLLLRGLVLGPTLDGSVFALIGDAVAHGRIPYRDLWDHKPPGVYLVNAAAGVALPFVGVWARAWLVSWLSTIGALVGLTILLARSGVQQSAIVLGLLLALPMVSAYHFVLGGGQTESVGLVFAVAGIALAIDGRDRSSMASGIVLAVAVAISLQFLPAAAAALVVMARRRRGRAVIGFAVGGVGVALAVVAWLAVNGALAAGYDSFIEYNRLYLIVNQRDRAQGLLTAALDGVLLLPLIFLALVRVASFRTRRPSDLELAAAVWVFAWLVFTGVQGVFFDHYATAVAPPLVILAAPALGGLLASIATHRRAVVLRALALTLMLVPPIVGVGLTEGSAHAADSLAAATTEVRRLTGPNDPIFVWGNEAAVYIEADRPPGSRFIFMFPLTLEGYATPARIDAILADWQARPPRVVIDATVNPGRVGGYPLTGSSGEANRPDATLDPLRDFILSRYQLEESVGTWDIYTLKELAER